MISMYYIWYLQGGASWKYVEDTSIWTDVTDFTTEGSTYRNERCKWIEWLISLKVVQLFYSSRYAEFLL